MRHIKKALFPPTLFSPPARRKALTVQCGTPLTPAGGKIGVVWSQMPDNPRAAGTDIAATAQTKGATAQTKGAGALASGQVVAAEVLCI